jgi:hypothetical protein
LLKIGTAMMKLTKMCWTEIFTKLHLILSSTLQSGIASLCQCLAQERCFCAYLKITQSGVASL